MSDERQALRERIQQLSHRLADCQRRLPAHSIRPHQLIEIEELEQELEDLRRRLAGLDGAESLD